MTSSRGLWGGVGLWLLAGAGCPAADDPPAGDAGGLAADAGTNAGMDAGRSDRGNAAPDVASACPASAGDPVNLVSAKVVLDGRTILLDPTCIRGELRQAIKFDGNFDYPTFFANRQSGPKNYAQLMVALNYDQKNTVPTCDVVGSQSRPEGAGSLTFETTELMDAYGKPLLVESHRGGTFTVTQYGNTVGARIIGSFECPIGDFGGRARGSIAGSFDVRIQ